MLIKLELVFSGSHTFLRRRFFGSFARSSASPFGRAHSLSWSLRRKTGFFFSALPNAIFFSSAAPLFCFLNLLNLGIGISMRLLPKRKGPSGSRIERKNGSERCVWLFGSSWCAFSGPFMNMSPGVGGVLHRCSSIEKATDRQNNYLGENGSTEWDCIDN